MGLQEQLDQAKAEVLRIEREIATGPCREFGHTWVSLGGANCGCHKDACCSVPVNQCTKCGDCDYGDNPEANEKRATCEHRNPVCENHDYEYDPMRRAEFCIHCDAMRQYDTYFDELERI